MSFRYHLNFVNGISTENSQEASDDEGPLTLDHQPHTDSVRTNGKKAEQLTERAAATVTISAPKAEIDAFKQMIIDNVNEVPVKTGDPDYNFEETVGKANYAPSLFISTTQQNMTAGRINQEFREFIRNAGYLIKALDEGYESTASPTINREIVDAMRKDGTCRKYFNNE